MNWKNRTFLLSIVILQSCAGYKVHIGSESNITDNNEIAIEDFEYKLYLIGDAGNAPQDNSTAVFRYLKSNLDKEKPNSAIVWLGDNIYPVGLAPEEDPEHALGVHRITSQLECMDNYPGKVFFIPGNHDWYKFGVSGIKRQENLIESYLSSRSVKNQKDGSYFLPDDGCGEIHALPLNEDLVLILMDSNWLLMEDRNKVDHCSYNDRNLFFDKLREKIQQNIDKQLIVCLHHPPYTYGSHGSRYKFKDYVFPLTQIKSGLLLPLPFSGIIFNQMRGYLTEQDAKHYAYRSLRELLDEELSHAKVPLVASGHEHNLQYIKQNNIRYIVSGAGSKKSAVGKGDGSIFAAANKGFVVLKYYSNKIDIEYVVPNDDGITSRIVYRDKVFLN